MIGLPFPVENPGFATEYQNVVTNGLECTCRLLYGEKRGN